MIVGTAGHIDHGKTALVKALTGIDADRLREEKARGITIDLGFAYERLAGDRITGFVDVPGHERFVHTMLAGASGIDLALLVVAVDDGVMPQTREHVAILDLLGVTRGVVALTKADLADEGRRAVVAAQVRALLAPTTLRNAAIMPVSVVNGEGLDDLRVALSGEEMRTPQVAADGRFRLAIDRCFTLTGAGVVVTGTVLSGSVSVGDRVTVSPSGLSARVRSIHAQNRATSESVAGERCALNLAGEAISKDAIRRGDMVVDTLLHAPTTRADVRLRLLPSETRPIDTWSPARFHHGSAETGARIIPLDGAISPGDVGYAQIVLDRPVAAAVGDRFVLRDVSAQRTIAGGVMLDLRAPQRKRRSPERLAQLDACGERDPSIALTRLFATAPFIVDLAVFARDRAMSDAQIAVAARQSKAVMFDTDGLRTALSELQWEQFGTALEHCLGSFHEANPEMQGMGRERLRLAVEPRLPPKAFAAALADRAQAGRLVIDGAFVRLPQHVVRLTTEDEILWSRIALQLGADTRFRPPRVRDLAGTLDCAETDIRRLLKLCARLGRVDQIAQDHFFLRSTTAEMVEFVRQLSVRGSQGEFNAAAFRDCMDNGRKVAIQILDFFDRHGVTLRRGDLRRLNMHRADLFDQRAIQGRETFPVGRPDFKSGWGSEPASGGFDSHSLPPSSPLGLSTPLPPSTPLLPATPLPPTTPLLPSTAA